MSNKKSLSEADIISKYIRPAITGSGWTEKQIREEVFFTDGRIFVKGIFVDVWGSYVWLCQSL